jgi:hypothetical protein
LHAHSNSLYRAILKHRKKKIKAFWDETPCILEEEPVAFTFHPEDEGIRSI